MSDGFLLHRRRIIAEKNAVSYKDAVPNQNTVTDKDTVTDEDAIANKYTVTHEDAGCQHHRSAAARAAIADGYFGSYR